MTRRVGLANHHAGEIERLCDQPRCDGRRHGLAYRRARRAIALQPPVAARVDGFDTVKCYARALGRLRDGVRGAEHDRARDFPVTETAGGGEHANVIALRQNDLEMTTTCCIEAALDGVHR